MELIKTLIAFFVGVALLFASVAGVLLVMALLWAIPTYLLWNWLMPDIFGLTEITIWQAIGINILSGVLFNRSNGKKKEKKTKNGGTKKEFILG